MPSRRRRPSDRGREDKGAVALPSTPACGRALNSSPGNAAAALAESDSGTRRPAVSSRPGAQLAGGGIAPGRRATLSGAASLARSIAEIERVGRARSVDLRPISATTDRRVGKEVPDLSLRINTTCGSRRGKDADLEPSRHFLMVGAMPRRSGGWPVGRAALAASQGEHPGARHVIDARAFSDSEEIGEEDLPRVLRARRPGRPAGLRHRKAVEDFERRLFESIAQLANQGRAAPGADGNQSSTVSTGS